MDDQDKKIQFETIKLRRKLKFVTRNQRFNTCNSTLCSKYVLTSIKNRHEIKIPNTDRTSVFKTFSFFRDDQLPVYGCADVKPENE